MAESIKDETATDVIEDIAALARRLAEKEPFKSANGPEALQAFATHLEQIVANADPSQAPVVNVAVWFKRKG